MSHSLCHLLQVYSSEATYLHFRLSSTAQPFNCFLQLSQLMQYPVHIFCRHLPFLQEKGVVIHCNLLLLLNSFLTSPICMEASNISEAFSVETLGLYLRHVPTVMVRLRDLEHFPGLWAHRQGAEPFSCALLCKLLHSLNPCLLSQFPSAHPGHIAPQGHFSLPQLLLARPELQQPLSRELLAAGRSCLPCLGCSWHQEPPVPFDLRSAMHLTIATPA